MIHIMGGHNAKDLLSKKSNKEVGVSAEKGYSCSRFELVSCEKGHISTSIESSKEPSTNRSLKRPHTEDLNPRATEDPPTENAQYEISNSESDDELNRVEDFVINVGSSLPFQGNLFRAIVLNVFIRVKKKKREKIYYAQMAPSIGKT